MLGVIVIHQELQLVPELTVAENLWLGRFPAKGGVIHSKALIETVRSKLEEIGIDVDPSAKVASLSIGARQMVEIAKAVMLDARVIALDEPTSSLSSRESEILFSLIDRLKAKGTVILYVSHRLDEIFRLCDSLTVLRDGKLAAHHPQIAETTREQIISEMVGREISNVWGWRERALGDVRLEVKGLSGPRLRHPISFSVRQGEILGFFGLIGAKPQRDGAAALRRRHQTSGPGHDRRRSRCAEQSESGDQCRAWCFAPRTASSTASSKGDRSRKISRSRRA